MGYPADLHLIERPSDSPTNPSVVLVHGSLDRAESFLRVMRRLPECNMVAYDRRGYQGSRAGGVVGFGGHVADLVAILTEARARAAVSVSAVGHSIGGDIVLGAALARPQVCDSVGIFEAPMPWLAFRRTPPDDDRARDDPADQVERFFSARVSPSAWQRLSEEGKAGRRADGPALAADMAGLRGPPPFDVMTLAVPALFGRGGPSSEAHHRALMGWLGAHVPGAAAYEISGSQHGAHLSHPDNFAAYVRAVVARAKP